MKFEKEVMQNLAMVTQLGISMLARSFSAYSQATGWMSISGFTA